MFYVGVYPNGRTRIFRSAIKVTKQSFPMYEFIMGPFESEDAAVMGADAAYEEARRRGIEANPRTKSIIRRRANPAFATRAQSRFARSESVERALARERMEHRSRSRTNPAARSTQIYAKALAIELMADGRKRRFSLKKAGKVVGMPNGDIKIQASGLIPGRNIEFSEFDRILAIEAQKGTGSLWPGELFRHDFKHSGPGHIDRRGTITVKSVNDKELWKTFDYS